VTPQSEYKPVTSAPPAPHPRSAYVDHDDRPATGRLPDACGRTETGDPLRQDALDPGFIANQLARRTRIMRLIVPV
jgi:hypothetical protein